MRMMVCRSELDSEEEWQLDQVIWTLLFSFILVIAMLGNSIVIWIILGRNITIQRRHLDHSL